MRSYDRIKAVIGGVVLGDGLRAKTFRGGAWLGAGSVAEQAVRFVRNMLLARLLAPGAFGTMAIVMSSASVVDTLTEVGMKAAIIQNPRGGKWVYLNASWWLGMGRAALSYCIVFALAPWIARFYGRAELSRLLRVALLGTLFAGAISPRSILTQKEMNFARWASIVNGGGICGVILTVVLSFFIRDVWALAIGYCSEQAFRCVFSYILCPGPPSYHVDGHAVRDLLTFSRQVFGSSFLSIIFTRADIFVLARLYSSGVLGLYSMGISLVTTPTGFFLNVVGQGLMPALSSVQDDMERVNRILVEVTSWIVLLGLPGAVFVCLAAPHVLAGVYGSRYVAAVGPLSVASGVALLMVLQHPTTCVLYAKGLPALHRHALAATSGTMLLAIYWACKFLGPIGGQVAALLAIAVGYLLQLMRLRTITGLKMLRYGAAFMPPALGSAAMLAIVLGARRLGLVTRPPVDIIFCVAGCLVAYAVSGAAHLRVSRKRSESCSSQTPVSEGVL